MSIIAYQALYIIAKPFKFSVSSMTHVHKPEARRNCKFHVVNKKSGHVRLFKFKLLIQFVFARHIVMETNLDTNEHNIRLFKYCSLFVPLRCSAICGHLHSPMNYKLSQVLAVLLLTGHSINSYLFTLL